MHKHELLFIGNLHMHSVSLQPTTSPSNQFLWGEEMTIALERTN